MGTTIPLVALWGTNISYLGIWPVVGMIAPGVAVLIDAAFWLVGVLTIAKFMADPQKYAS